MIFLQTSYSRLTVELPEIRPALEGALASGRTSVLDVVVDKEEIPPDSQLLASV